MKFVGLLPDQFVQIEASSEEEAQKLLKEKLLAEIAANPEPFILWENT